MTILIKTYKEADSNLPRNKSVHVQYIVYFNVKEMAAVIYMFILNMQLGTKR